MVYKVYIENSAGKLTKDTFILSFFHGFCKDISECLYFDFTPLECPWQLKISYISANISKITLDK